MDEIELLKRISKDLRTIAGWVTFIGVVTFFFAALVIWRNFF